jgi:hypothetical protein
MLLIGGIGLLLLAIMTVRDASDGEVDAAAPSTSAQAAEPLAKVPPDQAQSPTQGVEPSGAPQTDAESSGRTRASLVPVVSAGELAANAALYYGRVVSVHAEIDEVLGPQSFTLDEDRLGTSPDVLVLMPAVVTGSAPVADTYATVMGRVRPFVESSLTRTFDWFRPGDDVLIRIRARPVIVADWAKMANGTMLTSGNAPPAVLVTNAGRVGSVPGRFYGQRVLLPDATIDTVHSPRAFTLDDPAYLAEDDLLVVLPPKAKAPVGEHQVVSVRGTVRRFNADDFERDYQWFDAGDFDALRGWADRPVLVADFLRHEDGVELVLIDDLDWTSRTRLDGQDWWVQQAWEPLPQGQRDDPGRSGAASGAMPAAASAGPTPALSTLQPLLDAPNRRALAGQRVSIAGVPVQRAVGNRILLVGPSPDEAIAVRRPSDTPELSPGSQVQIQGLIRTVPGSLDGWQLDADERRALEAKQVFVDAETVQSSPR